MVHYATKVLGPWIKKKPIDNTGAQNWVMIVLLVKALRNKACAKSQRLILRYLCNHLAKVLFLVVV